MLKLRTLFRLHRGVGVVAASFAALLAVTGLLLNHTDDLGLGSRYVASDWVLDWYGVTVPDSRQSFQVGDHWITQIGERLYLDRTQLADSAPRLVGAVALPAAIAVVLEGRVMLLTPQGELMETLGSAEGVPSGIRAVGVEDGRLIVEAAHGYYSADPDLLRWDERDTGAAWASPADLPEEFSKALAQAYRGKGLPWERVILDLHSGRIFGKSGRLVFDIAAIFLFFLACTGVWMWWRIYRSTHDHAARRQRSSVQ